MADDDLFTALKMFGTGVKQYQVQSAIGDANDYVQQLKAADLSDQQKRSELQGLSNQLVMHLSGLGVQSDQVKQAAAAVAPKAFADSDAMMGEAIQSGNQTMKDQATEWQAHEDANTGSGDDGLARDRLNETIDKNTTSMLKGYGESLDSTRASSRSAFGAGAIAVQKAARVDALLGDPSTWKNLTTADMTLVAEGLSNVAKGGVATKEEIDALMPNTRGTAQARLQQFLTSNPSPAQLQGFAARYKNMLDRETLANKLETVDTMVSRANQGAKISTRPGAESQFKLSTATNFQKAGINVQPEDISIDKDGVHVAPIEAATKQAAAAANLTKKSIKFAESPDPTLSGPALQWLKQNGISPKMPATQAAAIVSRRFRLKMFE